MDGIKYVNLIEISIVIIEIRGVENGQLVVPVNNTLVHHTAVLAADTQPCVLDRRTAPSVMWITNKQSNLTNSMKKSSYKQTLQNNVMTCR